MWTKIATWLLTSKFGRALIATLFALVAMALGTSIGWIEGDRFGYTRGTDHANVQLATLQLQVAQANTRATAAARTAENAQTDALTAVAASYEKGKNDATADANAVIAGLRAGNLKLRDDWTPTIIAGVPTSAAAVAGADAAERRRQESAGRIVGAAEQCDAQVAGLQQVIRSYLAIINGSKPHAGTP